MRQPIVQHLQQLEKEYNIQVLYACETGSRAWGFASPDSDFDVRFIFVHPAPVYLSIQPPREHLQMMAEKDGQVLDFSGWELRKTLALLANGNMAPFEWLQSPEVYVDRLGFCESLWALAPAYFRPSAAAYHYLGTCHNSLKSGLQGEQINIKKYFYVLRPLLAAMWSLHRNAIPPMEFSALLNVIGTERSLLHRIDQLLQEKMQAPEGHMVPLDPVIYGFILEQMTWCRENNPSSGPKNLDWEPLNLFFRRYLPMT